MEVSGGHFFKHVVLSSFFGVLFLKENTKK